MPIWVWLSLAFALVATIASIVFVVVRGLALWRQLKRTGEEIGDGLQRVSLAADVAATAAERAAVAPVRLEPALVRLAASRARLDVLLAAWSDAMSPWRTARAYVPREKRA